MIEISWRDWKWTIGAFVLGSLIMIGVLHWSAADRATLCESVKYQLSQGKKLHWIYKDKYFTFSKYYIRDGYLYNYAGKKFCREKVQ